VDWDFRKRQPELLSDIVIPDIFGRDWISELPSFSRPDLLWIYIGSAGTRGPLHIDNYGTSAWLAVIAGRKRVRFLSGCRARSSVLARSDAFDDTLVTELADEVLEAEIGPGDVLFVPAGVWHAALNSEYCVSVSGNFLDGVSFRPFRQFLDQQWPVLEILRQQLRRLPAYGGNHQRDQLARALHELRDDLAESREVVEQLIRQLGTKP
jgi:ribosomal protein L16 Arg81 hydroxylase